MRNTINQPYIKRYNALGECTNPITRNKPYINYGRTRWKRRASYRQKISQRSLTRSRANRQIVKLPTGFKMIIHKIGVIARRFSKRK